MAEDSTQNAAPPAEGAEGAPAEGAEQQAAAKKKKMLMLASAGLAVVGVIVAVGVFFVFGGKKDDAAHDEKPATEIAKLAMFDVPEFTLNLLADEQAGGPRFLKITLSLELENEADAKNMAQLLPRLQDDWGNFLRQLRPTDLQGSAAMQRLKEGLLRRAVQTLDPVAVRAVYIRDMLVQ